jgi:hypothetical protein
MECFLAPSMDPWGHSTFTDKNASWLIEDGLLHPVMNAAQPEWIIPGNEDEPNPSSAMSLASRTSTSEG